MAFNPLIPKSTDQLSSSQGDILANFTALGAIAGNANPASASLNANSGFKWIYLAPQGATPPAGAAFPANRVALYSATNATTTRNELYVNRTNQPGVVTQIPMTAYRASATSGWAYLPSGVLMVWGFGTIVAGGTINVLYSSVAGFPGFTVGNSPQVTRFRASVPPADAFVLVSAYNTTQFTVQSSSGNNNVSFTWMSIGI